MKDLFEEVLSDYMDCEKVVGRELVISLMQIVELRKLNEHLSWLSLKEKERWEAL